MKRSFTSYIPIGRRPFLTRKERAHVAVGVDLAFDLARGTPIECGPELFRTGQPHMDSAPSFDPAVGEEYPAARAARIASRFDLAPPIEAFDFPGKGNIHDDTFLVVSGTGVRRREYLLQRINTRVFTRPRAVMAAMIACLESQRANLARGMLPDGHPWEPIRLVPTRDGKPYLECENLRGCTWWRLMVRIAGCVSYKSLGEIADRQRRLEVAEEAARGLAIHGALTSSVDVTRLESPLPGYRNTGIYYDQLKSVLAGSRSLEEAAPWLPQDHTLRAGTARHFLVHRAPDDYRRRLEDPELRPYVELACAMEDYGRTLERALQAGRIRTVAIHGDTKLENFLFDAAGGQVRALVDLDTIVPHTWLADWGDLVRSLVNPAGEKERDIERVQVDMEIYEALARGFLSAACAVTPAEIELMADAGPIIALELGVRFLADYLRGDTYFGLGALDPPDMNKRRAMVQLQLFRNLRACAGEARSLIGRLARAAPPTGRGGARA